MRGRCVSSVGGPSTRRRLNLSGRCDLKAACSLHSERVLQALDVLVAETDGAGQFAAGYRRKQTRWDRAQGKPEYRTLIALLFAEGGHDHPVVPPVWRIDPGALFDRGGFARASSRRRTDLKVGSLWSDTHCLSVTDEPIWQWTGADRDNRNSRRESIPSFLQHPGSIGGRAGHNYKKRIGTGNELSNLFSKQRSWL